MRHVIRKIPVVGLACILSACTIPVNTDKDTPHPTTSAETSAEPTVSDAPQSLGVEQKQLDTIISEVKAQYPGEIGIALSDGSHDWAAGMRDAKPAWSTSKVPLAIAALDAGTAQQGSLQAAITHSDNEAAKQLWSSLGDPESAKAKVEAVLKEGGVADAQVQSKVVREGFSSFGQTPLSPAQEARLAANLNCIKNSEQVISLMGQVSPDQSYGLGQIQGARFKGGWGPDLSGSYETRQLGVIDGENGQVGVALWVQPNSGDYQTGQAMLNAVVKKLQDSGVLKSAPGAPAQCTAK